MAHLSDISWPCLANNLIFHSKDCFNGSCYDFYSSRRNWNDAQRACRSKPGRDLVEIDSKAENDFLAELIKRKEYTNYYIGLRRDKTSKWLMIRYNLLI